MKCSDNTAKLDAALAKAQQQLKPAVKSARGHGYDYAALEEVTESAVEALSANGISFSQGIEETEEGKLRCVTRLSKDGEWIITYCPLRVATKGRNNEMQELGSAYTYGRRYALQALVGIAPITKKDFEKRQAREELSWGKDDDGASAGPKPSEAKKAAPVSAPATPNPEPASPAFAQMDKVKKKLQTIGADFDLVNDWVQVNAGGKSISSLAKSEPERIAPMLQYVKNNIDKFQLPR